jgi:peroxiredoxin Q/BCP
LTKLGMGALLVGVLAVAGKNLSAGEKGPAVGDAAPKFEATDDQGKAWKSTDHVGKKIVVLYFYPADFTGGCTAQACGFRDNAKPLTDKGIEVIGVSGDSAKTHGLFKKEHKLEFTLLADEEGKLAKQFGVPVNVAKGTVKVKGIGVVERGATISRWTVVIDREGKVAARYEVKNAGGDHKTVLDIVKKLEK